MTGWRRGVLQPKTTPAVDIANKTIIQGHTAVLGSRPAGSSASWAFPSEPFKSPQTTLVLLKHSQPPLGTLCVSPGFCARSLRVLLGLYLVYLLHMLINSPTSGSARASRWFCILIDPAPRSPSPRPRLCTPARTSHFHHAPTVHSPHCCCSWLSEVLDTPHRFLA